MERLNRLTLILGGPRSGTTWLSKIFDSHPDVLYRHEPDLVVIDEVVPHICPAGGEAAFVAATRTYFRDLLDLRTLKTAGSLPVFPKNYESAPLRLARQASIGALRAIRGVLPVATVNRWPVPERFDPARQADIHYVIKSVASLGRAGLLAQALPEARIILILRNPLGQVASRLRGLKDGRLERRERDLALLETEQARRFGLTEQRLLSCSEAEYLAWEWAVLNHKAAEELDGLPQARSLRHADLVREPLAQSRALFAFAGLSWQPATEEFIRLSTSHDGPEGYFQVMRDASKVLDNWRTQLTQAQQEEIRAVVAATPLARRWPELFPAAGTAHAA